MPSSHSPTAVRNALASTDSIALLDIRPSLDYVEGHVRESTWVPRHKLEQRLPYLMPNHSTPVVLCDNRGERSVRDAQWLETLGYESVGYLDGGIAAWREEGFDLIQAEGDVHATAFNYESKEFGEQVAATRDLPTIEPDELAAQRDGVTVVDVRNPPEYEKWGTIPGSVNIEGFDLPLYAETIRDNDEPVVVHCAGRTRSIIGTVTLQELGINNVYELENGTMGWQLSGYELTEGPGRPHELETDPQQQVQLQEAAERLLQDTDVLFLSPSELARLDDEIDDRQTVYVFDVRTEEEFAEGHLPDSLSVAGGQLIQTAGRYIAVRDAEIVLVSATHIRAAITAYWLDKMGFSNVRVLHGGTTAWTESDRRLDTNNEPKEPLGANIVEETVEFISATELAHTNREVTVVNVGELDVYTAGHVPGAWWAPRYEVANVLATDLDPTGTIVLTCEDGTISERAGAQLIHVGQVENLAILEGGLEAWQEADLETEKGEKRVLREPRKAVRKPYAQGEQEMEQYLTWEENLVK